MKQDFRRSIYIPYLMGLLVLIFISLSLFSSRAFAADIDTPRQIYIVYDNSGSMRDTSAAKEAAYGVELIAAMMEEGDQLIIYFMKDDGKYYVEEAYPDTGETLEDAVSRLHEDLVSLWQTGNTPIDGLKAAVTEIEKLDLEEMTPYLVVFTDGDFNLEGGGGDVTFPDLTACSATSIYCALGEDAKDAAGEVPNAAIVKSTKDGDSILEVFEEVGNLIYDRQSISAELSGGTLSVQLELPARRVIVLAQSESGGLTSDQVAEGSSGLSLQRGISVSSITINNKTGKELPGTTYQGAVNIYGADTGKLISSGTWSFSVPEGAELTVYVEYEMEFAMLITDEGSGESWDLSEEDAGEHFREGSYEVCVFYRDALTGELLDTSSSLYDGMEAEWTLDGEEAGSGQSIPLYLTEGEHTLACTVTPEGNIAQELEEEFSIRHRLGALSLEIEAPEDGFDIDQLEYGTEYVIVRLSEDGEDVSNLYDLACEAVSVDDASPYEYLCEETADGWKITPILREASPESSEDDSQEASKKSPVGTYSLTVRVSGSADGEELQEEEDTELTFYATEKEVEIADIMETAGALEFWFGGEWSEALTIGGEAVLAGAYVSDFQCESGESDGDAALVSRIVSSDDGEMSLEVSSGKWWKNLGDVWRGGSYTDTVAVAFLRYGKTCVGTCEVSISVEKLGWVGRLFLIFIAIVLWMLLVCLINFFLSFHVIRIHFYDHRGIVLARRRARRLCLRNCLVPGYIRATAKLKGWSGVPVSGGVPGRLILRVYPGGKCRVKNMQAVLDSGKFYKDGAPLNAMDAEFSLRDGLEWEIERSGGTERRIRIRIFTER